MVLSPAYLAAVDTYSDSGVSYSTSTSTSNPMFVLIMWVVLLPFIILAVAGLWKTFVKAGKPGWAVLVPIYNNYIMIEIAGRPSWWLILLFIPVANFVVQVVIAMDIAKAFGKSTAFGIFGLLLFSPIGYAILGFSKSTYQGGVAISAAPPSASPPSPPSSGTPPPPSVPTSNLPA